MIVDSDRYENLTAPAIRPDSETAHEGAFCPYCGERGGTVLIAGHKWHRDCCSAYDEEIENVEGVTFEEIDNVQWEPIE